MSFADCRVLLFIAAVLIHVGFGATLLLPVTRTEPGMHYLGGSTAALTSNYSSGLETEPRFHNVKEAFSYDQRSIAVHSSNDLLVTLRPSTKTILCLVPTQIGDCEFSFTPPDGLFGLNRTYQALHGLGDLEFYARPAGTQYKQLPYVSSMQDYPTYSYYTSAMSCPENPVIALDKDAWQIDASDLTPAYSRDSRWPLRVRRWYAAANDAVGGLLMWFTITNVDPFNTIEVGGLGAAMAFQGRWDGMNLTYMSNHAFLIDTYPGLDHGYITVKRLDGRGPVLVVIPENGTQLEAWRPLRGEDPASAFTDTPEWAVHTKAYQETLWRAAKGAPWNPPSSLLLQPNQSHTIGFRLLTAPNIRQVDDVLARAGKAVAVGVPGYVCSTSMERVQLYVKPPRGAVLSTITAEPAGSMLVVGGPTPSRQRVWTIVGLRCVLVGRARLVLQYSDGSRQAVHYNVLHDFKDQVDKLAEHLATVAWLPRETRDPFGRSASVMPWDRESKVHVMHDPRAFVVGLSDEAGAGPNVALARATQWAPASTPIARLDEYINSTLWGVKPELPFPVSLQDPVTGGVRASLFWVPTPGSSEQGMPGYTYETGDTSGWIWNRDRAVNVLGRAYNYPHQTAVYMAMYHLARDHDQVTSIHPATWYLDQALLTLRAMWKVARWYAQFGLMAGTVFRDVLEALVSEGRTADAAEVVEYMYNRTNVGLTFRGPDSCAGTDFGYCSCVPNPAQPLPPGQPANQLVCLPWTAHDFPYGSEFAFDTTGQEEVYHWSRFFGYDALANATLASILSFTPAMPHWAYNGAAVGWGDFSNNAKWTPWGGWERVLHHYRTGLNSIPVIEDFMRRPADTFLLRLGMGSVQGLVTNIDEDGAASMAFHADPAMLAHDPYTGDYGVGFFGHTRLAGSYLVYGDLDSGWTCYLCDITATEQQQDQALLQPGRCAGKAADSSEVVEIVPRDSLRKRLFVAPIGLLVVVEAGLIESARVDLGSKQVQVSLGPYAEVLFTKFRITVNVTAEGMQLPQLRLCSPAAEHVTALKFGRYVISPLPGHDRVTATLCWAATRTGE